MKKMIIIGTVAVCIVLCLGGVYLYGAYKIADIVSDEAAQDNISRFMTGAYTGYRELSEEYVVTLYKPLPNQGEARVTGVEPCLARENAQSYYEAYFNGLKADRPREVTEFFSSELKALWDKAYGVPDWDLYLLAQDWDNPSFEIAYVNGNSKEAEVSVKVRNFGVEKINLLKMVREGDCFLIDNFIADGYDVKELLTKQVGE